MKYDLKNSLRHGLIFFNQLLQMGPSCFFQVIVNPRHSLSYQHLFVGNHPLLL